MAGDVAGNKVVLRKQDGSGAGYIFNRRDADKFLKANPGQYVEESESETQAKQQAADEQAEAEQPAAKKPR